jgi:hypothetical protein
MSYTPEFHHNQQTPAQRWRSVQAAIGAAATDGRVIGQDAAALQLRYVAGEIDQVQVRDELLRWYQPDGGPAADVRPLPPAQPGRVYPYAAEMAALLVELATLPPYVPYTVVDINVPWLE